MKRSSHQLVLGDARELGAVRDATVDLVVTSPPYPMIEMWDECFRTMSPAAGQALDRGDGTAALEAMHRQLDRVWDQAHRVLTPGGFACINIGDATRTIGGQFQLFSNHARILAGAQRAGFTVLPDILWRKPTNAPNKFMGSGMLPAGAYVTYEHEYVLILRKGGKRRFASQADKARRRESAFFWEERNVWFSDIWQGLRGVGQKLGAGPARKRSAAFPLELAYRLVAMYSLQGDTVLDPFVGTGTTMVAAACQARNSVGVELDASLESLVDESMGTVPAVAADRGQQRIQAHLGFVEARQASGKPVKHCSERYGFPVMTLQEKDLVLHDAQVVSAGGGRWEFGHGELGPAP